MDKHEERYIYRASIRLRDGRRIFAWQYGLKACRIRLKHNLPKEPRLPGL
jgi:hypothetical protein